MTGNGDQDAGANLEIQEDQLQGTDPELAIRKTNKQKIYILLSDAKKIGEEQCDPVEGPGQMNNPGEEDRKAKQRECRRHVNDAVERGHLEMITGDVLIE